MDGVAVRDERTGVAASGIRKDGSRWAQEHPSRYLRGWVTGQDGVRRYCLAPLPGSFEHQALTETHEAVR